MIPKTIHYCWFGENTIPEEYKMYMKSWKEYMPDYEIIEWNESNFDIHCNVYCEQAYNKKKWAFVSDVARLYIIHKYGGIYLDTDVELVKTLTPLVSDSVGFIGFQNPYEVNTGLGFAAMPGNKCIEEMLNIYSQRKFVLEGDKMDLTPCPAANTVALIKCGLKTGKKESQSIQCLNGLNVFPEVYFDPMDKDKMKCHITENTYSIHHYSGTWLNNGTSVNRRIKMILPQSILNLREARISKRDIGRIERDAQ